MYAKRVLISEFLDSINIRTKSKYVGPVIRNAVYKGVGVVKRHFSE
jgi:hypothetical protein